MIIDHYARTTLAVEKNRALCEQKNHSQYDIFSLKLAYASLSLPKVTPERHTR